MEGIRRHGYKKGLWNMEEDKVLADYVKEHGVGKWSRIAKVTGLKRCGKSCRLRWMNYLSPNVKLGDFSKEEEDLIIRLHTLLGNRWSLIAGRIPGRTDNQVKNYWNTHVRKKLGHVIKKKKNKEEKSKVGGAPQKAVPNNEQKDSCNKTSSIGTTKHNTEYSDEGEKVVVQARSSRERSDNDQNFTAGTHDDEVMMITGAHFGSCINWFADTTDFFMDSIQDFFFDL